MMLPILPIFATLVNLAEINHALQKDFHAGERFAVTCTVISFSQVTNNATKVVSSSFAVQDAFGYGTLNCTNAIAAIQPADSDCCLFPFAKTDMNISVVPFLFSFSKSTDPQPRAPVFFNSLRSSP